MLTRRGALMIVRWGAIAGVVIAAPTALVGVANILHVTCGPLDYLLEPGAILTWMLIWGDTLTGSLRENIAIVAIAVATNGFAGFILGSGLAAASKAVRRIRATRLPRITILGLMLWIAVLASWIGAARLFDSLEQRNMGSSDDPLGRALVCAFLLVIMAVHTLGMRYPMRRLSHPWAVSALIIGMCVYLIFVIPTVLIGL